MPFECHLGQRELLKTINAVPDAPITMSGTAVAGVDYTVGVNGQFDKKRGQGTFSLTPSTVRDQRGHRDY
jgi:hypothetical protein